MKITFTGAHGAGKTTAMGILLKTLKESVGSYDSLGVLTSTTRELIDLGWESEQSGFELACIYLRRQWMIELEKKEAPYILSERWSMDETAYQMAKVRSKQTPERDQTHILRVAQMEMRWEIENYWDIVYYIPLDNRPVDGDGVRPTDKDYQISIDKLIQENLKPYKKSPKIRVMPTTLEDWEPYFKKEVESWKSKR